MIKRIVSASLSGGATVMGLSLAAAGTAFAFGGCVDSPQSPTWILAGIGGAAAGVPWLRAKWQTRRRNKHDK